MGTLEFARNLAIFCFYAMAIGFCISILIATMLGLIESIKGKKRKDTITREIAEILEKQLEKEIEAQLESERNKNNT